MILDMILAAQMRSHARLESRLSALGVDRNALQVALTSAIAAGVMERRVQRSALIDHIGQPDRAGPKRLSYDLTLWPEHMFDFGIHEGGWILYQGFALKEPVTSVLPLTLQSHMDAKRAFQIGYDTIVQVQDALGEAHTRQGWNGMEDLFYAADQGPNVAFEFDFGLLTGISTRNPILL